MSQFQGFDPLAEHLQEGAPRKRRYRAGGPNVVVFEYFEKPTLATMTHFPKCFRTPLMPVGRQEPAEKTTLLRFG